MSAKRSFLPPLRGILMLLLLLLPACGMSSPAENPANTATQPYVEQLTLPGGGYWGHPSPFGFSRGPGYMRASLLFDTLVWRDASGETIPWLATDWQLSTDGLTWTFTLREGVRWQDGEALTAEDVVFSVEYYQAHPGASWFMAQISEIESATAITENQVALKLTRPFAPFIATTAEAMFILPQHIWENVSDPQTFNEAAAFVGSGAYRLAEYSQEEGSYLFEHNPDFFLGAPYVRSIAFVPSSDELLGLINREIAAFDKFGGVTEEMLAPFRQEPYAIQEATGAWGMFLYFNLEKDTPLQDVRVRQAIAHAVDRQALVERVLFGFGSPGNPGFLPPANPFYNPDVLQYDHDVEKAQTLLDEAGYAGQPLQISYSTQGSLASPRIVEIIEVGLQEAGIPLELVPMDQASLDAAAKDGNYEILLTGFGGLGGDPDQLRRNFSRGSQAVGFSRARGYANINFDIFAGIQVTLNNVNERQALIAEMQSMLAEDLPALALYYTDRVVVYDAEIFDNWYYTPGGFGGGVPTPYNKHQFIVGLPKGLEIKGK